VERRLEARIAESQRTEAAANERAAHFDHDHRVGWFAGLGLVLVALAGVFVVHSRPAPIEATARVDEARTEVRHTTVLEQDGVVTSEDEPVSYRQEGRATWTLLPGSRVRVVSLGTAGADGDPTSLPPVVLALEQGAIYAEVVPQTRPETFVIEVDRTRVAVHGTAFTVTRLGDRADVQVFRGSVAVGPVGRAVHDGPTWLLSAGEHAAFSLDGASDARWVRRSPERDLESLVLPEPGSRSAEPSGKGSGMELSSPGAKIEPFPEVESDGRMTSERGSAVAGRDMRGEPHRFGSGEPQEVATRGSGPEHGVIAAAPPADQEPKTDSSRVLDEVLKGISQCYERQIASAGVQFSVESLLTVVIGANGAVKEGTFDPPLSPTLAACAEQSLASVKFPGESPGRKFQKPIRLSAPVHPHK
jgi:hypothetical protein